MFRVRFVLFFILKLLRNVQLVPTELSLGSFTVRVNPPLMSSTDSGSFKRRSGFLINYQSDGILRRLREPGETGYKIPRGTMYKQLRKSFDGWAGGRLAFIVARWRGLFSWRFVLTRHSASMRGTPAPLHLLLVSTAINGYMNRLVYQSDRHMSAPDIFICPRAPFFVPFIPVAPVAKGGMFEYVSGANYFGECLEWCGCVVCPGICTF